MKIKSLYSHILIISFFFLFSCEIPEEEEASQNLDGTWLNYDFINKEVSNEKLILDNGTYELYGGDVLVSSGSVGKCDNPTDYLGGDNDDSYYEYLFTPESGSLSRPVLFYYDISGPGVFTYNDETNTLYISGFIILDDNDLNDIYSVTAFDGHWVEVE